MRILDFLRLGGVIPSLKADNKEAALSELLEPIAEENPQLDKANLLTALISRENLGSTGIGGGIAIPHGKFEGIDKLAASFGRSPKGVNFNSMDNKPAYLFFMIIAPKNCAGEHLKALARISRLFKDPLLKASLQQAETAEEIFQILAEHDARVPQ
jgi:nitrogen PTS system EIIA component